MRTAMTTDRRRCSLRRKRSGVVMVEFALCAPILFFFFFTAFEFARVNMIRQSIENAAYEGSRRGIVPGATADDCRNAARAVLNSISAHVANITISPPELKANTNEVTVRIDVPINNNSWVAPYFFKDMTISSSMTMRRERFGTSTVP
jgi:Flp pilus assembly protein TadG